MSDLWIQKAIGKEGSYRDSVMRRYGKAGFSGCSTCKRGSCEGCTGYKIKKSVIDEDIKTKKGKIHKQAVLARTLRGF